MKFHDIEKGEFPDCHKNVVAYNRSGYVYGVVSMYGYAWICDRGTIACKHYPLWVYTSELFDSLMENNQ